MIETAHKNMTTAPSISPMDVGTAESRLDPISGNWTIFAPGRDLRPDDFSDKDSSTLKSDVECPFCCGNEAVTPASVWVGHLPDTASLSGLDEPSEEDWSVRVVPNKFPAVNGLASLDRVEKNAGTQRGPGLFRRQRICGGHEVVIESRRHVQSLTQLDVAEFDLVFQAYRDRIRHYRSVAGIQYISIFKNVGRQAGASLCHSHSQIIATDRIPQPIQASIETMRRHRANTGCCLRCDLIRAERKAKERIVACDDTSIAFCPFASHLPMLVRITSLEHQACFEDLGDRTFESVSRMVLRVVSWLEKIRPGTAYNFCLHTRPPGIVDPSDSYHWSIDIFPRMSQVAGFEWTSGCMINPVLPESAAISYRRCARAENPRYLL